jgi:chromatin remodeling complex protein RSC6
MAPKKKITPEATSTVADTSVAPTTTDTVVTTEVDNVSNFTIVLTRLQAFANELKDTISVVKQLQKEHAKMQKATTKKTKKTAASTGPRTLSGFAKPSQLSDELCEFMGVEKGTSMARTEVTRMINDYIKKNSLQSEEDKRHILPDAKLSKILNLTGDEKLTYFNLQKYMKHHFTKEA